MWVKFHHDVRFHEHELSCFLFHAAEPFETDHVFKSKDNRKLILGLMKYVLVDLCLVGKMFSIASRCRPRDYQPSQAPKFVVIWRFSVMFGVFTFSVSTEASRDR